MLLVVVKARSWKLRHDTFFFSFSHTSTFQLLDKQAVVTGVVPSFPPPRFFAFNFIARRVQPSHCSSIFHRGLLTHALALSASQFMRTKKSPRIYTSMHSGGFERTKLTYTRLEDSLIHHRGIGALFLSSRYYNTVALSF